MALLAWRYSFLLLIRLPVKNRTVLIPIPLAIFEDVVLALCSIAKVIISIKPDLAGKYSRGKISSETLQKLLEMPAILFQELRACGSFTLFRIWEDGKLIEVRII